MSNQVYSNEQLKYAPMPGINQYYKLAGSGGNTTIPAGGTPTNIPFQRAILIQGSGLTTSDTALTFVEAGYYSVKYNVAYEAATADLSITYRIKLIGGFDANDSSLDLIRYAVVGGGNPTRTASLSTVSYFNAGDAVELVGINNLGGGVGNNVTVFSDGSQLIVTKIA